MEPLQTPRIQRVEFCGEPAVHATNGQLSLTLVPGWGSNLISLKYIKKDIELLRTPRTKDEYVANPFIYGIPVLFPPNRIADGTFTFQDRIYGFKINEPEFNNHEHGLVHDEAWNLGELSVDIEHETISCLTGFSSSSRPAVLAQLPHDFSITMRYTLRGCTLHLSTTITNHDKAPFPWGFGYHPTFQFPFRSDTSDELCSCTVNVDKHWKLDNRSLPTGECLHDTLSDQLRRGMRVDTISLDDVFSSKKTCPNEAVLRDQGSQMQVTVSCDDNFQFWVVYNDDGKKGYLCPEPYTWITNAPNLSLPHNDTGLRVLMPGESHTLHCRINASDIV